MAAPCHRVQIYKALVCIVFVLIALQYLLSGAIDRRSIETIFAINTSRPPQQRALVIYGPAPVSTSNTNEDEEEQQLQQQQLASGNVPGNFTLIANISASASSAPLNASFLSAMPRSNNASGASSIQQEDASLPAKFKNATTATPVTLIGNATSTQMPRCPLVPPNLLGPIAVSKTPPNLMIMEKTFTKVKPGGRGTPEGCLARYRVAIVVPFRDRFQHLMTLLYNLHPLLLRQQLDYQIFVIEQEGTSQFNRAMVMNVGYVEALKERPFDCFIFHDVDLLPEDDRNLYTCPEQPRHMSVAVDKFFYKLPYSGLFGGVSAMTTEQFRLVNGFSNVFWGWGGEDDDMTNRIKAQGLHISRYPANIARYKMLTHKKEKANPKRYEFLKTGSNRFSTDGLSNLQYEVLLKKKPKLYTWFLVRLTPPSQPS